MILKGEFEKRVFISFFIVSFVLIFIMTFLEWGLTVYIINQHEDKQITERITQVQTRINHFTSERASLINRTVRETDLANHLLVPSKPVISALLHSYSQDNDGLFTIYDNELNLLYGEKIIALEEYLPLIMFSKRFFDNQFFFKMGHSSFHATYDLLLDEGTADEKLLGIIIYIEEFDIIELGMSFDFPLYQVSQIDNVDFLPLSPELKEAANRLKTSMIKAISHYKYNDISRLSADNAAGLLVRYDLNQEPALFIMIPFVRDFNSFAQKGLLVFALIILAAALLIISLAGTWFSNHIIAPVKDVSLKMREIEQNPTYLAPMPKKYHGILGDMIKTFNNMNSSLFSYSKSLLEYKTIINNLDSGILWMDKDFQIILCNPSILEIFNKESFQEVIGKTLTEFTGLEKNSLDKAKKRGLFIPHLEVNSDKEQKIIKFVIFSIRPVDDPAGLRYVASITDITKESKETKARQRLEMELIKSNRLAELGRLVEGVVHNINSPLNTIVGYAQLIKKQYPECNDIDKVSSAGNNIAKTVKQLMLKVREDSISMMRPIDINEVVKQELEMCRHNIFFSQSVELVTRLAPLDKKVNAAHGDISLCIANLMNNAIQAMEESEKKILTIETKLEKEMIAIEITDIGTGISKENLAKIFSPDFSTKNAGDGEGFGLGLPISKSIAEKYHGCLQVKSKVGKGSTFTLYLPWYREV
jgi:signal transduction histidine kinase